MDTSQGSAWVVRLFALVLSVHSIYGLAYDDIRIGGVRTGQGGRHYHGVSTWLIASGIVLFSVGLAFSTYSPKQGSWLAMNRKALVGFLMVAGLVLYFWERLYP